MQLNTGKLANVIILIKSTPEMIIRRLLSIGYHCILSAFNRNYAFVLILPFKYSYPVCVIITNNIPICRE